MNKYVKLTQVVALAALASTSGASNAETLLGPTPYLSAADSPFDGLSFDYFHLEDFEDHLLNVPGALATVGTGVTSVVFGADFENIDSVDADDGVLDGNGSNGDSFFGTLGSAGAEFTFSAIELGNLPTHAGIVWTDGLGTTAFRAFDENGESLGLIGPVLIADGATNGATNEDNFFGVIHPGGISKIIVSNTVGGIEVDHLQYGFVPNQDSDGDGIVNSLDNCTDTGNPDQVDTDNDGYGNSCDADFNNDCTINFIDLAAFSNEFLSMNALFDLNNDGVVNFLDFTVLANNFLGAPGPGLGACDN